MPEPVFQFGEFELDCGRFQLLRKGRPLRVERKPLELLILLVSRQGHLVTRREIVDRLWTRDVFVDTDHSINTAIQKLRHLLRDDPESPKFIETVTGMGYRFVAPVSQQQEVPQDKVEQPQPALPVVNPPSSDEASPSAIASIPSHRSRSHLYFEGAIAVTIVLALALAAWDIVRPLPPLRILSYTQITHDGGHKIPVGTDGTRLYFSRDSGDPIGVVSVNGGEPTSIHTSLGQYALGDVFHDGSALLIGSNSGSGYALWKLQVPGGALQRIAGNDLLMEWGGMAVSPNGQSIALITTRGDLIMMDADGSHVHQFLSPPKEMSAPVGGDIIWSPDGMKLRFTWNHRFWEVASDGSGLHPIRPNWRTGDWECCGDWTPDGKFFVLESRDSVTNSPFVYGQLWAFDERLRTFRIKTGGPFQLTTGPMLWLGVVSGRDNREIFAEGAVFRGELVRFDKATEELRPMWHGISAEFVEYSPDGKSVVYVTFPQGVLWRANPDGSDPVQLTSPPLFPLNPHWSPDGSRIVYFTMGYGEPRRAYVVSADGGESKEISAANLQTDIVDPTWSPDGKSIAFSRGAGDNPPYTDIEILDMATRQATKVPGSEGLWSPRWSPDGRYIVALDHAWSIVIFDLSMRQWRTLEKGACGYPTWSRDSRFIFFVNSLASYGVYRVPVAGGKRERVVDLSNVNLTGVLGDWFGLDRDGVPLLLRDAGSDQIYSLALSQK